MALLNTGCSAAKQVDKAAGEKAERYKDQAVDTDLKRMSESLSSLIKCQQD
jgi:hypothetical protein